MTGRPDLRPVLLCYDGSESSVRAIEAAGALSIGGAALVCHAWAGLSRVMLRGSYDLLPAPLAEAVDELDELDRQAADRVADEGVQVARRAGFEAQPLPLREGATTWRTLVEAAAHHEARLTVVGAHGQSGLARVLLGSVSSAVLTHSRSPVLVVPDAPREPVDGESLLVAYDGSEDSRHAIDVAGRLFPGRRADVATLWESWVAHGPVPVGAVGPVLGMEVELDEIAQDQAGRKAAEGVDCADRAGLAADPLATRVAAGPLWRGLIDVASERNAAAIVMGARGLTGISAALGSVSHGVVHHSDVPVLVVPREG